MLCVCVCVCACGRVCVCACVCVCGEGDRAARLARIRAWCPSCRSNNIGAAGAQALAAALRDSALTALDLRCERAHVWYIVREDREAAGARRPAARGCAA